MDYILTFSIEEDGDEVNITDRFIAWYINRQDGPKRVGPDTWYYSPGIGFTRTSDDDGIALTTLGFDKDHLHRILTDFFGFVASGKGYAAIAGAAPDLPGGVVLVTNDPAVTPDPLGSESRGLMRSYQAAAILTGSHLFGSVHDGMFGLVDTAASAAESEEVEDEGQVRSLGAGPWIFADLQPPADVTEIDETTFLIGGTRQSAGDVMGRMLNIPEVTVYADDYFTYADPANQAHAAAQPFPTDAGLFTEIRLELPPDLTEEQIRIRVAQQAEATGFSEVYLIQAYQDTESLVQVAPLHADGSLGPMRVLKLAF